MSNNINYKGRDKVSHTDRLKDKKDVYNKVHQLIGHKGLDYDQRTNLLKTKKSLHHQIKQLDKLVKR